MNKQRVYFMSVQNHHGSSSAGNQARPGRGGLGPVPGKQGRSQSIQLIESLAGGLRTTYRAEPETEIGDAFADLIARLHMAENRAG